MEDFLEKMLQVMVKGDRVNYRDRRGHYASGNLTCLRDQYWSWTGEPETNKTDAKGMMKMMIGTAIEKGLIEGVLRHMSFVGYHFRGTQIAVGQSNPNWDGYLDGLIYRQKGDQWEPFVLEIKTKSGYGADLFVQNPEPTAGYMIQIGLYLKNLHEKGITNKGCFLYVLLSDKTFGEIITIDVEYDPATQTVRTTHWKNSSGESGVVTVTADIKAALDRWRRLDEYIAKRETPAGEYQYKYPLTLDNVRAISDAKLKKICEGVIVYGDWEPLYSRYKDKGLAADGLSPARTAEELKIPIAEYRRRHPRTKI